MSKHGSGKPKWEHYFKGNKKIQTLVKKTTEVVEFKNPTIKKTLAEGAEILVHPKSSYEQYDKKYLISIVGSDKQYLISGDNVEKPIQGDCDNIKPQNFGLKGTNSLTENFSIRQVISAVKTSLAPGKREDLHPVVKKFLLFLTDAVEKNSKTAKFKEFATIKKNGTYMAKIAKNFGEVLSALIVITNKDLFPNLDIKKDDLIFFPKEENYALTDFMIVGKVDGKKREKYRFSVKSEMKGKNTNTVKPEGVLSLFKGNSALKKTWENTIEYKIIKTLDEGTVRSGPLNVILDLIKSNRADLKPKSKNLTVAKIKIALESYKTLGKVSKDVEKTFYEAHHHVVDVSKKLEYTKFFLDVINSQVYYIIMTGYTQDGVPTWETIGDKSGKKQKDFSKKKIVLRYKDDQNKIGFQT